MQEKTVLLEKSKGIGIVTLNRPDELNAMNVILCRDLLEALNEVAMDREVRTVLLTGRGRSFCAEGDVKKMRDSASVEVFLRELTLYLHAAISEIARMPKPVVAGVNGVAAGAGFSLMLACDMVLASDDAYFTMAYSSIGLNPDGSSTYFLPKLVGYKKALELIYTSKRFSAQEALESGLINRVIPAGQFHEKLIAFAGELAQGPTVALAKGKELVIAGLTESLETQMENERRAIATISNTKDFYEGISAFTEKRKPIFKGC